MNKSYRYRCYPTAAQAAYAEQMFGACRWVWNWGLQRRHETYLQTGKSLSWGELGRELTALKKVEGTAWLNEMIAWSLQQPLRNLQKSFDKFFAKQQSYPSFKSKRKSKKSFSTYASTVDARGVFLSRKMGNIRVIWHRPLPDNAKIGYVTMSQDRSGRYWVSINFSAPDPEPLTPTDNVVGLDLGLKTLVTTSNDEKIENPRFGRAAEKKLAHAQRVVDRKQKGSKNQQKARKRVAKIHAQVADQRRDYLDKLTTRLVYENQVIAVEDLNVRGMSNRKMRLGKFVSDVSFYTIRQMLEYKSKDVGREFIVIDKYFPSSKTCSSCGHLLGSLELSERKWTCPSCGIKHDRDVNAAKNILAAGFAATASGGSVRPALALASTGAIL